MAGDDEKVRLDAKAAGWKVFRDIARPVKVASMTRFQPPVPWDTLRKAVFEAGEATLVAADAVTFKRHVGLPEYEARCRFDEVALQTARRVLMSQGISATDPQGVSHAQIEITEAMERAALLAQIPAHVTADSVMAALFAALEEHLDWTEIESKHPARTRAVRAAVRDALRGMK